MNDYFRINNFEKCSACRWAYNVAVVGVVGVEFCTKDVRLFIDRLRPLSLIVEPLFDEVVVSTDEERSPMLSSPFME